MKTSKKLVLALLCVGTLFHPPPADAQKGPVALEPIASIEPPAVWIDVRQPGKVEGALRKNAWLRQQLSGPLGRGFLGSWGAFLGTRGEDLRATFKGAIADAALAALFAQPFRVAFWTTRDETHAPALIVPQPRDSFRLLFAAIDGVARKGALSARCPGDTGPGLLIGRWLLAEHALYVAQREERVVISRHPAAVLQGYCGNTTIEPGGAAASVEIAPDRIGRGAQVAQVLAGLGGTFRIDLDVDGDRLVGAGLSAAIDKPERLGKGAASDALLKLLPASAPVVLSAHLSLPESLSERSLIQFWKSAMGAGGPAPHVVGRTATIAWWPRGDSRLPLEVALLWSRAEDAPALGHIFSGKNRLVSASLCGHAALASSEEILSHLRRACSGQEPSFHDLGRSVVRGLQSPATLQLALQPGRALPALLTDGYWSEQEVPPGKHGAGPKEIEDAARDLSSLPPLGFSGTSDAKRLVPQGFGS